MKKDDEAQARVVERVFVPIAPKVDKLVERINNLSIPRDYAAEKVPEGLVDSLPPEGKVNRKFVMNIFKIFIVKLDMLNTE